jgi:hypothetical protein
MTSRAATHGSSLRTAAAVGALVLAAVGCDGSDGSDRAATSAAGSAPDAPTSTRLSGVSLPQGIPTTIVHPRPLPDGRLEHAIAVAEAIRAAGLGCTSTVVEPPPPSGLPGDPTERVDCDVDADTIPIILFDDRDAVEQSLTILRRRVCSGTSDPPTDLTYVAGENWVAFPQPDTTARTIAARLDQRVTTLHC